MLKRIITLLLAVAMLLSMCALVGCGGGKGGQGKTPVQNAGNSDEQYFLDMPTELRGTTVKFATWIDHTATDTAAVLSGFEVETGMKVELVQVGQTEYISKLIGLIGSDQAPDVVVENDAFPRTLGVLMPLEKETTGLDVNDPFWDQEITKTFTIGKYCYLVNAANTTWTFASVMTYFDKTVLAENGIVTPAELVEQNNWNKDSLWTLMEQIKATCGFTKPGVAIEFDQWLDMHGGGQLAWDNEADAFKNTIKDENTRKAIDYLMKGRDAGLLRVVRNHDNDITKGILPVQIAGPYGLRKNPGWFWEMDADDLGYTYAPKVNASDENYPASAKLRAYGICKGSKNPKGAAYFLRYFLNGDNYNLDEMFKSEEAKEMYLKLRAMQDVSKPNFMDSVGRVTDDSYTSFSAVRELVYGTAAQVSVNLEMSYNTCEGIAANANKYIKEIIDNQ